MFVKINKNYLLVIFFLTLYLSNHRLSSVDSFHQFIRHQYFHLREAKPLLAQVLNGCSYVIYTVRCSPFFYFICHIYIHFSKITNCDLKRIVVILRTKVVLLAFKPLLHNPFLWKERKINSFIAVIVLLVIASLVVRYLPLNHSTLPHPERNIPCGADLLLPYIRLSSVLPYFPSDLNIFVMHFFFCSMFGWT